MNSIVVLSCSMRLLFLATPVAVRRKHADGLEDLECPGWPILDAAILNLAILDVAIINSAILN